MNYRGRVTRIIGNDVYVQVSALAVDQDFGPMEMVNSTDYEVDDYVLVAQVDGAAEDVIIVGKLLNDLSEIGPALVLPTTANSFFVGQADGSYTWATTAQAKTALGIDTEVQPVNRGGTGKTSYTVGNYIQATGTTTLSERTPTQVKSDIGLSNVDNTSDLAKPISTAVQTALDTKVSGEGGTASSGIDFNTLLTPQRTAFGVTNSAASTNIPEGVRGILTVESAGGSGGYLTQRYQTIDTNRIWTRTYAFVTSTWTPWTSIYSAMVELGTSVDLNTLTTNGVYVQSQSAEAAAGSNYPTPYAGMLKVWSNGGTLHWQEYTTTRDYGQVIYRRAASSGVWSAWTLVSGGSWTNLSLQNAWVPYGSVYGDPQYKVEGKTVKLRGLAKTTAAVSATNTIATLASLAPLTNAIFIQSSSASPTTGAASTGTAHTHSTFSGGSNLMRVDVTSAGIIQVADGAKTIPATGWVSLDQIEWDLD